jgi:hypothetical protein
VAVEDLVARIRHLEVDLASAVRVQTPNFRGFQRLQVSVA